MSREKNIHRCGICGRVNQYGLAVWVCPECTGKYCSDHTFDFKKNMFNPDAETAVCPDCGSSLRKAAAV